ncbi:unconventional myosin-XVIIIa-like [Hibiscus syriacus]|uniref:glucan endo-1,3-beta-D-glucosidase n=1 Tax=Hibiscus syriacus TaxID=106335 RepID=A0A6A3BCL5_HIBSY|nr:unconventional myosin-XVIIIa-like [Hibiscus syriacus]
MLKKLKRRVKTLITKPFKKPKKHRKPPTPAVPPPPPPSSPPMAPPQIPPKAQPFLFPSVQSSVLPDPSRFFSPKLLSSPLPTNSFFQNFTLKNGDQPEYIHPYLIKSADSSLSISYPSQFHNPSFIYQIFVPDLTVSASDRTSPAHVISSYSDLSVTLDFPSSNLRFFLVRGSPFLTCSVTGNTAVSISTVHAILSFSSNSSLTKHTVQLNNGQTWLIYTSSSLSLNHDLSSIGSGGFSGIIRIAVMPGSDPMYESVLDQFSSCYPTSGVAVLNKPLCLEYKWEKKGWGDLLMLAHPLHFDILASDGCDVKVLENLKYKSIDGELVGVVGDSWVMKPHQVSVTWHSIKGVDEESYAEIVTALAKDVEALDSSAISTTSSYFYGKLIARAARLALIAEEVCYVDVIPAIRKFLKDTIEPWLDGTFNGNGFLYESKWGGIVTKQGSADSGADFGFGVYNDHHYHIGYFLYGIAVLAKIDPAWEGGGLTEFADGRNQESTSEAVNAYYSAALMGLAYGDSHLVATGSTLMAFEIQAAQTWWHVKEGDNLYGDEFTRENRVVGVLWANKRDSGLWFAPPDWRECRLGIQLLPILPISEVLFSDIEFTRELVNWTLPALERDGVGEGWKGFVYALEAIYDEESALEKIKKLNGHDDGNSLTNLLWWVHSRGKEQEIEHGAGGKYCWFTYYCD